MDIIYDIKEFNWVVEDNSFYAEAPFLIPCEPYDYYSHAFPTERKQFFIKNYATGGLRRFRFVSEFERIDAGEDDFYPHTFWEFVSEDDIYCRISLII